MKSIDKQINLEMILLSGVVHWKVTWKEKNGLLKKRTFEENKECF